MIYSFDLVVMLACAVAFYRLGEMEYDRGFLLGAISILLWFATSFGLHWGWLECITGQIGFFVILWMINMFRKPGFK